MWFRLERLAKEWGNVILAFGLAFFAILEGAEKIAIALGVGGLVLFFSKIRARKQRATLIQALDSLPNGFCMCDSEDRMVLWNSSFAKLYPGCEKLFQTGTPFVDIVRAVANSGLVNVGPDPEKWVNERMLLHNSPDASYQQQFANGEWILIREHATRDGGHVSLRFDISDLKRELAEKNAAIRAMIDNINQGICLFDQDLVLRAYNQRFAELFNLPIAFLEDGCTMEDIVYYNASRGEYGKGDVHELVGQRLKQVYHRERYKIEHLRPNGTILEMTGHPLDGGGLVIVYNDITWRKQDENAIRAREAAARRYAETQAAILDSLSACVSLIDTKGRIIMLNQGWKKVMLEAGWSQVPPAPGDDFRATLDLAGPLWLENPQVRDDVERNVLAVLDGYLKDFACEYSFIREGEKRWFSLNVVAVSSFGLEEGGAVITHNDITALKKGEDQARLALAVLETVAEGIVVTGSDNRIEMINPAFTAITGYGPGEALKRNPSFLKSGQQDELFYKNLWYELHQKGRWSGEIWNRRKNGEIFPEWLSISLVRGQEGEIVHYVGVFTDITQRKQDEKRIWYQANFDALTGLPNRILFEDRLKQAINQSKREGRKIALMFIDLDRFKFVNDSLGHAMGDLLLQEAAQRLKRNLRASDTVARMGGDEFTVILPTINTREDVARVAEKINHTLAQPFNLGGNEVYISGSIGITICPDDGADSASLTKNADAAMYRAKAKGKNIFAFYLPEMMTSAISNFAMEGELHKAITQGDFVLYYQPIINTLSGKISSCEALLRWRNPLNNLILPGEFLPLAEEAGIIVPIGEWVLEEACKEALSWPELKLGVNVSIRQLLSHNFVSRLEEILDRTGMPRARLELEIPETAMLEYSQPLEEILRQIHALGIRIAIDDFGTGYSSLGHLQNLPIDTLKIDPGFIRDLPDNPHDSAMVKAILGMGESLNLLTVAEGVENANQAEFLAQNGCKEIQGFHFSRPLPAHELKRLLGI